MRSLFVAATGQNVGKTTICLGLLAALKKRFTNIGFIKPVGQHHIMVENEQIVDKDAYLFKKYFHLKSLWTDMSPVIIPAGFTRNFLNGEITTEKMLKQIILSFNKISTDHDFTLVEGTGHIGVGSILNLCNARVAAELGLDMVIISSGGLGSAHDELSLNMAMAEKYGVTVKGVILNRVFEDKKLMIKEYFPKSLEKWKIPLLGCIPFDSFLSKPTVKDFEILFNTTIISGYKHLYRHFERVKLFAGSIEEYLHEMEPNQLLIIPASREDVILLTIKKHLEVLNDEGKDYGGGIILTGKLEPSISILEEIKNSNIPVIYTQTNSYDAMKKITSFIAKIRLEDKLKIEKAIDLIEKNINFEHLLL